MKNMLMTVIAPALLFSGRVHGGTLSTAVPGNDSVTIVKLKMMNAEGYRIYFHTVADGQLRKDSAYTMEDGYRVYTLAAPYSRVQQLLILDPQFKVVPAKGEIPPPQLQFLLKKGATITIEGNAALPAISKISSDDPDVMQYEDYRKQETRLYVNAYMLTKQSFLFESMNDTATVKDLRKELDTIYHQLDAHKRAFVYAHPGAYTSLELFQSFYQRLPPPEAKKVFDQFPEAWQQYGPGKEIAAYFRNLDKTAAGNKLPVFQSMGIDGKMVDVAKLKGKVLLVDFWGSWCGPCRRSHPHLKDLYAQYKKKGLEIIGIASEGAYEASQNVWRKAVKEDGINWLQVLNDPEKNDLVEAFAVTAFPTKFIVDRQGNIVLKLIGDEHEELDKTLAALLP